MLRLGLGLLLAICPLGCQFGRFSASLERDTLIPKLGVNMLPQQWEPPIDDEEGGDEADGADAG